MSPSNQTYWNADLVAQFKNLHVLIIGDVMIDRYLYGHVDRISPEAPVPILQFQSEECRPGGAANVALNVQALGARASVLSVCGTGSHHELLSETFAHYNLSAENILADATRITTVKTRLSSGGHQLMRIDREQTDYLSKDSLDWIKARLEQILQEDRPDVVILQDYDKGVLSPDWIEFILEKCKSKQIPVCVDPKHKHFWLYKGAALFKPNLKELSAGLNKKITKEHQPISEAISILDKELQAEHYLVTLSEAGIYFRSNETEGIVPIDRPVAVADVSGAGDTVISVAALCTSIKVPLQTITQLCNIAATQVCEKPGVVSVDINSLLQRV